jgi:aquaporin Z
MKKYLAEFLGTFALVFIGCGGAVIAGKYIGFMGIAFCFGLVLLGLVYAIGGISGCHVNPAVSIAMLLSGRMKAKDMGMYILFQCLGAIAGAGVVYGVASGLPGYSLAVNGLGQNGFGAYSPGGYSLAACFGAEVVLTALFVSVILASTGKNSQKGFAGIAIGLTLAFIHLVGIPITGTSVNPARSLGPAAIAGGAALSQLWVFWLAPIIGAVIAAVIWRYGLEKE